ncbi:MAG TPA: altronate dehydratase family protein [Jatrophihabitantaceae bacterium]
MSPDLRLHPDDDVALVLKGRDGIPSGHKVAVRDIAEGDPVRKYGTVIGFASRPISAGEHVHGHNLRVGDFDRDYAPAADVAPPAPPPDDLRLTFDGYRRADGRAGTRNYVAVLTSVNCSATVARQIAARVRVDDFPDVDGVVAFTHGTGCGMAGDGEGMTMLRRSLSGYAGNPNVGAVLVVGLGCEVNQLAGFDLPDTVPVETMTIQELGGTVRTVREGVERITALLPTVAAARREPISVSKLVLGLQCGGSDGYSGITANPALGVAADLLVSAGGTAVLGETPEVYGAEHLLTRRAISPDVAARLIERIHWWESYTDGTLDNNPSPGNKAGGLTTILEKSVGAVAKGGRSPLTAVYEYAEPIRECGFVFMDTPGYDPVSVTGMVAGGANVICFTTGRGSVFGCKPVPSLKLATNTGVYERMPDDMDINCGVIADRTATVEQVGRRVYDAVIDVASGRRTASEELGFGDEEFAPWQLGAVY